MREESATPDSLIAAIAACQHGVVSTAQLVAVGISKDAIFHRLRSGRMHRVHRGVYSVGHPALSIEGRWMAGVLACGEGAALSHRSAAALWGLLPAINDAVDVTTPGGGSRRKRPGVRRHRTRSFRAADISQRKNIPVTTPARTIADLRGTVPGRQFRRAIRQAEVIGLEIGRHVEADRTRSELEHRFLWLCRRDRLPMPEPNAPVGRFTVDFLWHEPRLIVETDGYRYHRGRQAFEDDRARDIELRLLGYEVVRFTYRQVLDDPAHVAATVRTLLSSPGVQANPQVGGAPSS